MVHSAMRRPHGKCFLFPGFYREMKKYREIFPGFFNPYLENFPGFGNNEQFVTHALFAHNFVNTDPFLIKPVPNERYEEGCSIGAGFVKNGALLTKLWANKVWEPSKDNFVP